VAVSVVAGGEALHARSTTADNETVVTPIGVGGRGVGNGDGGAGDASEPRMARTAATALPPPALGDDAGAGTEAHGGGTETLLCVAGAPAPFAPVAPADSGLNDDDDAGNDEEDQV
jgi:hypothetical protein